MGSVCLTFAGWSPVSELTVSPVSSPEYSRAQSAAGILLSSAEETGGISFEGQTLMARLHHVFPKSHRRIHFLINLLEG